MPCGMTVSSEKNQQLSYIKCSNIHGECIYASLLLHFNVTDLLIFLKINSYDIQKYVNTLPKYLSRKGKALLEFLYFSLYQKSFHRSCIYYTATSQRALSLSDTNMYMYMYVYIYTHIIQDVSKLDCQTSKTNFRDTNASACRVSHRHCSLSSNASL